MSQSGFASFRVRLAAASAQEMNPLVSQAPLP